MRNKKAKAIRKFIYVDLPDKQERRKVKYLRHPDTGVVYATGHRRAYQDGKRTIKETQRKG